MQEKDSTLYNGCSVPLKIPSLGITVQPRVDAIVSIGPSLCSVNGV